MSTTWLDPNQGATVAAGAALIAVVALGVVIAQGAQLRRMKQQWAALLREASGDSIEVLLRRHLEERALLRQELTDLHGRVEVLEAKMRRAKRHLGVVKYDAFEEVSGGQSFSVALYDDEGDGVVLSSVVGRSVARLYAKGVKNGEAPTPLSDEEHLAMRDGWVGEGRGGKS